MSRFLSMGAQSLAAKEAAIGGKLPYAAHLDEATVRTRDGLLVQVLHLRGFPAETASDEELNYRKTVRETLLRSAASSRLAIYHHVVRRRASPTLDGDVDDPFCRRLDDAWRARLATRRLYVNDIFLTLVRRPLQGGAGLLERLVKRPGHDAALEARELRQLHATRETFAAALAPYGPRTLTLYDGPNGLCSEPAEF
ncbi:MAG TPA: VirB4 family type IV secretion/conjugal transfer ATPase, partial [Caulobacteraceae bacterium]|nr:VirB4 family type IV secretion/conjugal transfer ATPase [Caulobacteraceae bacterium]